MRIRGLWKLPDGRDWLWWKLGLALMSGDMFSKSLTPFSVDGWGFVPFLNGDLLQKDLCHHATEVRNKFKGLDLIECLKNYGQSCIALYRRQ